MSVKPSSSHQTGHGLGVALCLILASIAGLVGCDSDSTEPCWVGVDTLFVSSIGSVSTTADVQAVFAEYLAYADTSGTGLSDGAIEWTFERATRDHVFEGTQYWAVWHYARYPGTAEPVLRRLLDVDERGVLVVGLGCI